MASTYDYSLIEFSSNLSNLETNLGENLQSVIETFSNSRLDLPLKRLGEIAKAHYKAGKYLKEKIDPKKDEYLNLWKICNIYSAIAVDLDNAMRDTRSYLRTKMSLERKTIEKPKKKTIFENLLANKNSENEHEKYRWFKKFNKEERRHRKGTGSSLDMEKEATSDSKSTPPTPPSIRTIPHLKTTTNPIDPPINNPSRPVAPPRLIATTIPAPSAPKSAPSTPLNRRSEQPKPNYAPTIYSTLQKNSSIDGKPSVLIKEHSLRHSDESEKEFCRVRKETSVEVEKESFRNPTQVSVYSSNEINHYVNIRPPISQKPRIFPMDTNTEQPVRFRELGKSSFPTMISIECPSTSPIPSPRKYLQSSDAPSSQRSSSSAYSSNYSSSSPANVTTFSIDENHSRTCPTIDYARMIRIASNEALKN